MKWHRLKLQGSFSPSFPSFPPSAVQYVTLCNVPFWSAPHICTALLKRPESVGAAPLLWQRPSRLAVMERRCRSVVVGWLLRQSNRSGGLCVTFSSHWRRSPSYGRRCDRVAHLLRRFKHLQGSRLGHQGPPSCPSFFIFIIVLCPLPSYHLHLKQSHSTVWIFSRYFMNRSHLTGFLLYRVTL